ncbi:MAG: GGDEF domain-containing protein, partial [Actinomycetes bacterium]
DLPELVTRTNDLTVASTAVIDEAIAAEREALTDTASSAAARGLVLFGLAAMLLLVPLLLGGSAVRRRFRAITSAAAQISIDPLTGVGNRNHLRAETETKVSDDAHHWHLAAAIDMDRFKLIPDTWGHAVGDRVLVEVAQRLTVIVDEWRGSVPGASGTVVRLGGDEFLLTLHAPAPINIDAVRRRLDEVRSTCISVSARDDTKPGVARPTDRVQLAFSVGLATALAPVALDDLMHLADLASYEEKAVRSGADPRRRRPDDTGTTERQTSEHGAADRTSTSAAGDDV